jgi:hemolysin activation/secretion protein
MNAKPLVHHQPRSKGKMKTKLTYCAPQVFGAMFYLMCSTSAHAQVYQRIAPNQPAAQPTPALSVPQAPPPLPSSAAVVLPSLKAVVFVPGPTGLVATGLPLSAGGPGGIATANVALLNQPAFQAQIAAYIGKPLTLDVLNKIASLTLAWYRAHGAPFVDISVPPQNINNGLVQVLVTEYRVGNVTVSGNKWFSSDSIANASGIVPGQTLTTAGLEADLSWLNQNPFRTVNAVFQPGDTTGTTDVDLETHDRIPFRVYAGYDNEGVPGLGMDEWDVGFNWGDGLGLGQVISYQLTRTFTGRFTGNSVSDTIPLPWRDKLLIFGSYEQQTPDLGKYFNELGHSGQASIRYVAALPGTSWLQQDLQIGYDFKITNSNLEFGGFNLFSKAAEINQFVLTYDGNETDRLGAMTVENDLIFSPGNWLGGNTTAAFEAMVPYARARYAYDRLGFTRTTILPAGFSMVTRILGQLSNENLMDSEELAAGGPDSVSGYNTSTALGSDGMLINEAITAPAFSPSHLLGLNLPETDLVQLGAFFDYAYLTQNHPLPNLPTRVDMESVGGTVGYTLGENINVQFAMGCQLSNAPGFNKRGAFGQVSVVVGY